MTYNINMQVFNDTFFEALQNKCFFSPQVIQELKDSKISFREAVNTLGMSFQSDLPVIRLACQVVNDMKGLPELEPAAFENCYAEYAHEVEERLNEALVFQKGW